MARTDGTRDGRANNGGWRPGAGRRRSRLVAHTHEGVILQIERAAANLGVTPEQYAGKLLELALKQERFYIDGRDFR